MTFTPTHTDFTLSPFTGMTRESWRDAGKYLLTGIFANLASADEPLVMPRKETEITYPHLHADTEQQARERKAEIFEGLTRSFFIASVLIHDEPDIAVAGIPLRDYYKRHILRCCTRGDRYYVGDYAEMQALLRAAGIDDPFRPFQQTVETCALVIGLWACKEHIWNRYTAHERDTIAAFLSGWAHAPTVPQNWRLFNMLDLAFLHGEGYPIDERIMLDHAQAILGYYAGDGWYRDGQSFDYYSCWAFNFYAPLWNLWYGYEHAPDIATMFEANSNALMQTYPRFFDRDGFVTMWGRSCIYRNAATSAFDGNLFLRHPTVDCGWARRISSGALLQFLQRDDFLYTGVPTLGFYGQFAPLVQGYSCAESPFWLGKAFLCLHLPPEHPFWTATENEGEWTALATAANADDVPQTTTSQIENDRADTSIADNDTNTGDERQPNMCPVVAELPTSTNERSPAQVTPTSSATTTHKTSPAPSAIDTACTAPVTFFATGTVQQTVLDGAALCITNHGVNGETVLRTGKVIKRADDLHGIWNYGKLCYNTKWPWEATPSPQFVNDGVESTVAYKAHITTATAENKQLSTEVASTSTDAASISILHSANDDSSAIVADDGAKVTTAQKNHTTVTSADLSQRIAAHVESANVATSNFCVNLNMPAVESQQYVLTDGTTGATQYANATFWAGERAGILYRRQFFGYSMERETHWTQEINLADFPVAHGIIRVDKLRLHRRPVTFTLGAYGFPDNGTHIERHFCGNAQALVLTGRDHSGRMRQLAMTVWNGWETLNVIHSIGSNPDSTKSIIVYATIALHRQYDASEPYMLISQVLTKEDSVPFTDAELFPLAAIQYSDRYSTGAYGALTLTLCDGTKRTIDFDGIEGRLTL